MSRLTLRLPDTLHHQLTNQAAREGVSLNQFIVYALTRQASQNYNVQSIAPEEIQQQENAFKALLQELGNASPEDIKTVLDERDIVTLAPELNAEDVAMFKQKILGLGEMSNKKMSSQKVSSKAAKILQDKNSSEIQKKLAGSVLSQADPDKQTGVEMGTIASKVLQSTKYSDETKSLGGSVLSQSNKEK